MLFDIKFRTSAPADLVPGAVREGSYMVATGVSDDVVKTVTKAGFIVYCTESDIQEAVKEAPKEAKKASTKAAEKAPEAPEVPEVPEAPETEVEAAGEIVVEAEVKVPEVKPTRRRRSA